MLLENSQVSASRSRKAYFGETDFPAMILRKERTSRRGLAPARCSLVIGAI